MDPSSLSKPSPEQGLPLSNVAGSKPKTEPTTPTKEQIKAIAKESIPTPKGDLELLKMQITDANQVQQEFYQFADEMGWRIPEKEKIFYNLANHSTELKSTKPIDILSYLIRERLKIINNFPHEFIAQLKAKEGKYPFLKTYIKDLEAFIDIAKTVKDQQGIITEGLLQRIVAFTNKNSSNLFHIVNTVRIFTSEDNYVFFIKQLIHRDLGESDTPSFKGSLVLEILKDVCRPGSNDQFPLHSFWDDTKEFSQETFFEKISLNDPDLLQFMASHLWGTETEVIKHFLKSDNKNMAWKVIFDEFAKVHPSHLESFLETNWPPDEAALKDFIGSDKFFLSAFFQTDMSDSRIPILSKFFKQHKRDDLQNYLNDRLLRKIFEVIETPEDNVPLALEGLKNAQEIFESFPGDVDLTKLRDLLIKKYEKIIKSNANLEKEIRQLKEELLDYGGYSDYSIHLRVTSNEPVPDKNEEDVTPKGLKEEELIKKSKTLASLENIEYYLKELKSYRYPPK